MGTTKRVALQCAVLLAWAGLAGGVVQAASAGYPASSVVASSASSQASTPAAVLSTRAADVTAAPSTSSDELSEQEMPSAMPMTGASEPTAEPSSSSSVASSPVPASTAPTSQPRPTASTASTAPATPARPAETPQSDAGSIVLTTGGSAQSIELGPGTGRARLTSRRLDGSRNVPTYVVVFCDGRATGSATFNTDSASETSHEVGYSGASCRAKVSAGAVTGGSQRISVRLDGKQAMGGSKPVVVRQPWSSALVTSSRDFGLTVPAGSSGLLGVQITGCTSKNAAGGGDTDATITDGCAGAMQPGGSSTVLVEVYSAGARVASRQVTISYARHHDNVSLVVPNVPSGAVTVRVSVLGGAPVLVHGPGTTFVGAV